MKVTVRLGEPIWRAVGQRKVEIEAPGADLTLPGLVERLETAYPRLGEELRGDAGTTVVGVVDYQLTFFLQDRLVRPADVAHERVPDGAEVMIMLPMAGG